MLRLFYFAALVTLLLLSENLGYHGDATPSLLVAGRNIGTFHTVQSSPWQLRPSANSNRVHRARHPITRKDATMGGRELLPSERGGNSEYSRIFKAGKEQLHELSELGAKKMNLLNMDLHALQRKTLQPPANASFQIIYNIQDEDGDGMGLISLASGTMEGRVTTQPEGDKERGGISTRMTSVNTFLIQLPSSYRRARLLKSPQSLGRGKNTLNILVGVGAGTRSSNVVSSLREWGLECADIDILLFTRLDLAQCGGLTLRNRRRAFPNANVYLESSLLRQTHDKNGALRWSLAVDVSRAILDEFAPYFNESAVVPFPVGQNLLPGIESVCLATHCVKTNAGHFNPEPGVNSASMRGASMENEALQLGYLITTMQGKKCLATDLIFSGKQITDTESPLTLELNGAHISTARPFPINRLLSWLDEENILLLSSHLPFPGTARCFKDDAKHGTYEFRPVHDIVINKAADVSTLSEGVRVDPQNLLNLNALLRKWLMQLSRELDKSQDTIRNPSRVIFNDIISALNSSAAHSSIATTALVSTSKQHLRFFTKQIQVAKQKLDNAARDAGEKLSAAEEAGRSLFQHHFAAPTLANISTSGTNSTIDVAVKGSETFNASLFRASMPERLKGLEDQMSEIRYNIGVKRAFITFLHRQLLVAMKREDEEKKIEELKIRIGREEHRLTQLKKNMRSLKKIVVEFEMIDHKYDAAARAEAREQQLKTFLGRVLRSLHRMIGYYDQSKNGLSESAGSPASTHSQASFLEEEPVGDKNLCSDQRKECQQDVGCTNTMMCSSVCEADVICISQCANLIVTAHSRKIIKKYQRCIEGDGDYDDTNATAAKSRSGITDAKEINRHHQHHNHSPRFRSTKPARSPFPNNQHHRFRRVVSKLNKDTHSPPVLKDPMWRSGRGEYLDTRGKAVESEDFPEGDKNEQEVCVGCLLIWEKVKEAFNISTIFYPSDAEKNEVTRQHMVEHLIATQCKESVSVLQLACADIKKAKHEMIDEFLKGCPVPEMCFLEDMCWNKIFTDPKTTYLHSTPKNVHQNLRTIAMPSLERTNLSRWVGKWTLGKDIDYQGFWPKLVSGWEDGVENMLGGV